MKCVSIYKILTDITDTTIKYNTIPDKYMHLLEEIRDRLLSLTYLFNNTKYYRLSAVILKVLDIIHNIIRLDHQKEYNDLAIVSYNLEKYIYTNSLYEDIKIACHIEYIKSNKNIDIEKISKIFDIDLSINKEYEINISDDLKPFIQLTDKDISTLSDEDMLKYIEKYMYLPENRILEIYQVALHNTTE